MEKGNPAQFGRAMGQLGIEMIPAYSPEARGRSERAFKTHQDRLDGILCEHHERVVGHDNCVRFRRRVL